MGRDTTADKKPLLEDAEQNIGNSSIVQPQAGPAVGSATTVPQQNPPRIINLTAGSASGQTTSVIYAVSRLNSNQNPVPGIPGPITGVLEFGNGGRSTKMEFDLPVGPFVGSFTAVAQASQPQDGVTIVSVPTGVIRAFARYDNLLIAPLLGTNGQVCLADVQGAPRQGPGAPYTAPIIPISIPAEPVQVQAMAAYYTRRFSLTYRTLYCYVGPNVGGGPPTAVLVLSVPAPAIAPVHYVLPAFTRSLKILRQPLTAALDVDLRDSLHVVDNIALAAGASSPIIPIMGHETIVSIQSHGVGDTVTLLALCCEVGI